MSINQTAEYSYFISYTNSHTQTQTHLSTYLSRYRYKDVLKKKKKRQLIPDLFLKGLFCLLVLFLLQLLVSALL